MKNQTDFTLRDAGPEDRAVAQAVTVAAYEEYAASMPPFAWEAYRQNIRETVGDPAPAKHIVAEQDGAIVGSVLLFPPMEDVTPVPGASFSNEWPEARLLAVLPATRGQGIARTPMEECAQRTLKAG
jgi:predicted N-acetyltransferase YhbS